MAEENTTPRAFYLKERRKLSGMTQEQLANVIGTTKGVISQLESGHMRYNEGWVTSTSQALNIAPFLLFVHPREDKCDVRLSRIKSAWPDLTDAQRDALVGVADSFSKPPRDPE